MEAIKESLESPAGVLFPYRNMAAGTTDTEAIRDVLVTYWTAVRDVFPEAWGMPATTSRLMHGVGIRSMGRLMERVMPHVDVRNPNALERATTEVTRVEGICRWTSGSWEDLGLPWDELQNTPRHISALSNLLARKYLDARAGR